MELLTKISLLLKSLAELLKKNGKILNRIPLCIVLPLVLAVFTRPDFFMLTVEVYVVLYVLTTCYAVSRWPGQHGKPRKIGFGRPLAALLASVPVALLVCGFLLVFNQLSGMLPFLIGSIRGWNVALAAILILVLVFLFAVNHIFVFHIYLSEDISFRQAMRRSRYLMTNGRWLPIRSRWLPLIAIGGVCVLAVSGVEKLSLAITVALISHYAAQLSSLDVVVLILDLAQRTAVLLLFAWAVVAAAGLYRSFAFLAEER
jgi:hypothetical protein